jgi:hypothetical protein
MLSLFLKKLFFSQKWSFLLKCLGQNSHQSISKVIFSHQILLDATTKHKYSTFRLQLSKKNLQNTDFFFLSFLAIFSIFEAGARPSALKILESCSIKVISNECSQLFGLHLWLIIAYFDFPPP